MNPPPDAKASGHMGEIMGQVGGEWQVSDWGNRMTKHGAPMSYWGPDPSRAGWRQMHSLDYFQYYRPNCR
jgi:hypothetical protein